MEKRDEKERKKEKELVAGVASGRVGLWAMRHCRTEAMTRRLWSVSQ